jgi:hypothetical protein
MSKRRQRQPQIDHPGETANPPRLASPGNAGVAASIRRLQASVGNRAVVNLLTGSTAVAVQVALSGPQRELPHRRHVEQAFHQDLRDIEVHFGDRDAARGLRMLGAVAATVGRSVAFESPTPTLPEVAHEVAHVLQAANSQSRSAASTTDPREPVELEAARIAKAAEAGRPLLGAPRTVLAAGRIGRQVNLSLAPARVTTPAFPPGPPIPGTIGPTRDESIDVEGNRIARAARGNRWYLSAELAQPSFPHAPGYRFELLPLNPTASYHALRSRCEAIRDEQLRNAEGLRGDMKYWFAKVYYFVTVNELAAIDAATYQYPHMKMQEVILFHATYQQNLNHWLAGEKDRVEANWRASFSQAESAGGDWMLPRSKEISNALLPSIEAHIRFDLPRAIAAVYDTYYSGIPGTSMQDFWQDFSNMGPVFERAADALAPELESESYWLDPGDWGWMRDALFPWFFHLGLEREMAWEKAEAISRMRGVGLEAMDRSIRAEMTAMHPNLEPFEVGDETVSGYDWLNQPGIPMQAPGPLPIAPPAHEPPDLPAKLYFRLALPRGDEALEDAVRSDQDLRPLLLLALWTRSVRNAEIQLEGHASSEGEEAMNISLSAARAELIQFFLWRAGADLDNNRIRVVPMGEVDAKRGSEWRYVTIRVSGNPEEKRQVWSPAEGVPAEALSGWLR